MQNKMPKRTKQDYDAQDQEEDWTVLVFSQMGKAK